MDVDLEITLKELEAKLNGKTVILGIGNPLRADDAWGLLLTEKLLGKIRHVVFVVQTAPENFLGRVVKEKPDVVLCIDAVDFGGRVAELRLFDLDSIETKNLFFTHNTSLKLLADYLRESIKTKLYLLAIQPGNTAFNEKMSPEIENQVEKLKGWFLKKYPLCRRSINYHNHDYESRENKDWQKSYQANY
jgi:hydrogenase 3 maturation protease